MMTPTEHFERYARTKATRAYFTLMVLFQENLLARSNLARITPCFWHCFCYVSVNELETLYLTVSVTPRHCFCHVGCRGHWHPLDSDQSASANQ